MEPNLLYRLLGHPQLKRVLDFAFRPRNVGLKLVAGGVAILAAAAAGGFAFDLAYVDPGSGTSLSFKSGEGAPAIIISATVVVSVMLICVGALVAIYDLIVTRRRDARKKNVIVELRGLHSGPSSPPTPAAIGLPPVAVQNVPIDFRPQAEGKLVDPEVALQKLDALRPTIAAAIAGRDEADVTVAIGGLAATPVLFLAGMLIDDEAHVVLYDWDREHRAWRGLDGMDDGKRALAVDYSTLPTGAKRAVLALSLSYAVDEDALKRRFSADAAIVHMRIEDPLVNQFWSMTKQEAIAKSFIETVQQLLHRGVQRLDLIIAAPASLSIRLGMAYDRRLLPDVTVHQYERSTASGYPWSLKMPTHGLTRAAVERAPHAGTTTTA